MTPPSRHSIRIPGYDYSEVGPYFITICTHQRKTLLGEIKDQEIVLSEAGGMVHQSWQDLPQRFPGVVLDAFVVMPNHVHGVLGLVGAGLALPEAGAASSAPTADGALAVKKVTLPAIVRTFKSLSAIHVNRALSRQGQPFWQRNYYEHVIRDEKSLDRVREYILHNPLRWALDAENPRPQGRDEFDRWLASFKKRPNSKNFP